MSGWSEGQSCWEEEDTSGGKDEEDHSSLKEEEEQEQARGGHRRMMRKGVYGCKSALTHLGRHRGDHFIPKDEETIRKTKNRRLGQQKRRIERSNLNHNRF